MRFSVSATGSRFRGDATAANSSWQYRRRRPGDPLRLQPLVPAQHSLAGTGDGLYFCASILSRSSGSSGSIPDGTSRGTRCPRRERSPGERFVLSIKSECLDRIVPIGERHLRRAIQEYVEHDHTERTHQGLDNRLIEGVPERGSGMVARRDRVRRSDGRGVFTAATVRSRRRRARQRRPHRAHEARVDRAGDVLQDAPRRGGRTCRRGGGTPGVR